MNLIKNFSESGRILGQIRFLFFVLMTICLVTMWNVPTTSAAANAADDHTAHVAQETVSTCVTCNQHEQLMAKLNDLKQSARLLSHRVNKVGTKLDDLEQCGCAQK